MASLTQHELEVFKQKRWFIMHHRDRCTICGKEFDVHENSYIGHMDDGSYAYTCESCSKNLQGATMYTNRQKRCYHIPEPTVKLWRYMDFAKFLSLLESESLFFTRIDHFVDPFEGALGVQANEEAWAIKEKAWRKRWIEMERKSTNDNISNDELEKLANQKFKIYRENIRNWREMNYVSCWHQSDYESEAMWQLYTRDSKQGVAIQTTFERLYKSLPVVQQAEFGMVNYVDYREYNNGTSKNTIHPFEAPWYKRISFKHENEFRVIIEDNRKPGFRDWDKTITVDLNMLIENVYISPQADKWFAKLVCDIIRKRYTLPLNVCQSNLNESPFY